MKRLIIFNKLLLQHHIRNYKRNASTFALTETQLSSNSTNDAKAVSDLFLRDQLVHVTNELHPSIVRAFIESSSAPNPSPAISQLLQRSQVALIDLNHKLARKHYRPSLLQAGNKTQSFLNVRSTLEKQSSMALHESIVNDSSEEIKGLIALMHIFMPSSVIVWKELDTILTNQYLLSSSMNEEENGTSQRVFPVKKAEVALLASYTILNAVKLLKFNLRDFQIHKLMMHHFLKAEAYLSEGKKVSGRNMNPFVYNIPFMTEKNHLNSVGDTKELRDSIPLELLSLQLHLFSQLDPKKEHRIFTPTNSPPVNSHSFKGKAPPIPRSTFKRLEWRLSDHCLEIFSNSNSPIPLQTLQFIWQSLPFIELPNQYMLYTLLYQQIEKSIAANPLQVINREEIVCSLFESMVRSRNKSILLISQIYELLIKYGVDYEICGMRLFSALIDLNCLEYAPNLIETMIHHSDIHFLKFISHAGLKGDLPLSPVGKEKLYELLYYQWNKHATTAAITSPLPETSPIVKFRNDFVMTLFFFHRDDSHSKYYKLLQKYETYFQQPSIVAQYNDDHTLGLLRYYSVIGRKPIPLFNELYKKMLSSLPHLTSLQISTLLWCCARLNYSDTSSPSSSSSSLQSIVDQYLKTISFKQEEQKFGIKSKKSDVVEIFHTFWSMTVLQQINLTIFEQFSSKLFDYYVSIQSYEEKNFLFRILSQIYNELYIQYKATANSVSNENNHSPRPTQQKDTNQPVASAIPPLHSTNPPITTTLVDEDELELLTNGQVLHQPALPFLNVPFPSSLLQLQQFLDKESKKFLKFSEQHVTSTIHGKISGLLKSRGIFHENEKLLPNYYLIDIFIPYRAGYPWSNLLKKDIVLEIDGPYHFESFAGEPMGRTVMKKRHVESAGFHFVSFPYTLLHPYQSDAEKYERIVEVIMTVASKSAEADSK